MSIQVVKNQTRWLSWLRWRELHLSIGVKQDNNNQWGFSTHQYIWSHDSGVREIGHSGEGGEPPKPLSSRNICLLVSSWSRRWRRWRSWWRWWSLVTVGTLHTTSCVWPKSPSAMITIMLRLEVWNKRWWWWLWRWWWYHLRAVRSLRAGPSLSPNPVVRWDSVRRGRQPPSILLSRNTWHMWIIRLLFGEMLTNFSVKIYFKVLKTGVYANFNAGSDLSW